MAEILLSAFLGVLFEKLASTTLKNFVLYKGIDAEIKRWQRSLNQIQDVLTDASHKEITNQSVKRWLNDLQHLAYDIDDVLDDLAYQAMDREFNHESSKPITRKTWSFSKEKERLVFLARDGLCEASNSEVASKKEHVTPTLLKCAGKHHTRDLPKFLAGSKP